MKVLLTGADGFLGSHILRNLIRRGYSVRAFLQKNRNHATINGLTYEPFYGDLMNEDDIDQAIHGCDYLIHTVAITDIWPNRNPYFWKINYDAVKKLAVAVKKHNIRRFIHIGTANSFGYGTKEAPGDESSPYSFATFGLDYMDSKKAAQDFLLGEVTNNDLPVVIINPTFMIGEYDSKPGTGAMVVAILQEKLASYTAGGRCVVYVNDVAVAVVNAIEKGRIGECYIAGNANLSYKDLFTLISKTANVKIPGFILPYPLLLFLGHCSELISKLSKTPPLFSVSMVRIGNEENYYSSAKAIKELGMPQTAIEIAVQRSINWFRENGYA